MASTKEKIYAEMENIEAVLNEIEKVKDMPHKEHVILVGIGGYLQNVYMGIENILKQLLLHNNILVSDTPSWHKALLNLSVEHSFITREIADKIGKYLFFRHFFTHTYGFLLEEEKLRPLMHNIFDVYSEFKEEIENILRRLEKVD